MNSGELSQFTNHWYVTADNGDVVVRVFPDMSLGETETGELSLDVGDALLSLSIDTNGSLEVFVLDGGELESEDGEFTGSQHLAFDAAAQIRLPNNILRVDKDILSDAGADAPSLPCAVWRATRIDTAQPPPVLDLNTPEPSTSETITADFDAPDSGAPEYEEPQTISITTEWPKLQEVPDKTPGRQKNRWGAIVVTASACVLIGLAYVAMRVTGTPEQSAPLVRQVEIVKASRQPAARAAIEEALTAAVPNRRQVPDTSKPPPTPSTIPKTAAPGTTAVTVIPPNEPIADDTTATPAVAQAKPVSRNVPTTEVKQPEVLSNTATAPQSTRPQPTRRNTVRQRELARVEPAPAPTPIARDAKQAREARAALLATEVAAAELRREQEQAQTALLRYERDLLAAELALAQGRLTHPPENSAYTLYKQLVASNPESSEARRGFQALGAALVNRAFAEVAAKRWSDAQATLAAAAEVGASPGLVADLGREVAYQQRLADAEAGRFDALYPAAELVALNRTTPRLGRYAPDGIDLVQVEFTISIAGNVQDIEVLGAQPQQLERVVRQAVTDWRFEPVLSGSRPIPVRTRIGLEIP